MNGFIDDERTKEPLQVNKGEKLKKLTEEVSKGIKEAENNKVPGEDLRTGEH